MSNELSHFDAYAIFLECADDELVSYINNLNQYLMSNPWLSHIFLSELGTENLSFKNFARLKRVENQIPEGATHFVYFETKKPYQIVRENGKLSLEKQNFDNIIPFNEPLKQPPDRSLRKIIVFPPSGEPLDQFDRLFKLAKNCLVQKD